MTQIEDIRNRYDEKFQLSEFAEAYQLALELIKTDPSNFVSYNLAGRALFRNGDNCNAERYFLIALSICENNENCLSFLSQINLNENNFELTMVYLEKLIKIKSSYKLEKIRAFIHLYPSCEHAREKIFLMV
ncbi:MAG: hypothetical protein JXR76_01245 [Deltaproteobacteria bacterium]|nr:hypothetical protein [Deltaproteobacteria bacterium]